jgi:hypothetical protein
MSVSTMDPRNLDSTPPGSRRLSQVAKRIAIPRGIQGTAWGPVSKTCRDDLGIEFDGWQDGLGQLLLAKNADKRIAHTVGGFGLSAMRQIGKCVRGSSMDGARQSPR